MWEWEKRPGRSNAGISHFNWELGNSWIDVAKILLIPAVPAASQFLYWDFLGISTSGSKYMLEFQENLCSVLHHPIPGGLLVASSTASEKGTR